MIMEIKFADTDVALIETDRAAETNLPVAVIQKARQQLNIIRAAPDVQTMSAWKSLRYSEGSQGIDGKQLVSVFADWKMILHVDETCSPSKVVVLSVQEVAQGVT